MGALEQEIKAYENQREEIERLHFNKWIVMRGDEIVGTFDDDREAVGFAITKFGRGPYLIRQVGAPPMRLPASVILGRRHG